MDLTTMTYEVRDGVAHVRFARPEGANAVNPAFSADLRAVMVAIEFDSAVKAVSVTAEGKVFCAGGDLKLFYERAPTCRRWRRTCWSIFTARSTR